MENSKRDAIDMLLDPECDDPIEMTDGNGEPISFEQEAVIEYRGGIYGLLIPKVKITGLDDGEMLFFEIVNKKNARCLKLVTDKKVIDAVFAEYVKLYAENETSATDDSENE